MSPIPEPSITVSPDWTCPRCEQPLPPSIELRATMSAPATSLYKCTKCRAEWHTEDLEEAHSKPGDPAQGWRECMAEDQRRGLKGGGGGGTGKAKEKKFIRGHQAAPWEEDETPDIKTEKVEKYLNNIDFKLWTGLRKYGDEVSSNFLRTVISQKIFEKLSKTA